MIRHDKNHLYFVLFGRKKIKQIQNSWFDFKSYETFKTKKGHMKYHRKMKNECADTMKSFLKNMQSWDFELKTREKMLMEKIFFFVYKIIKQPECTPKTKGNITLLSQNII